MPGFASVSNPPVASDRRRGVGRAKVGAGCSFRCGRGLLRGGLTPRSAHVMYKLFTEFRESAAWRPNRRIRATPNRDAHSFHVARRSRCRSQGYRCCRPSLVGCTARALVRRTCRDSGNRRTRGFVTHDRWSGPQRMTLSYSTRSGSHCEFLSTGRR